MHIKVYVVRHTVPESTKPIFTPVPSCCSTHAIVEGAKLVAEQGEDATKSEIARTYEDPSEFLQEEFSEQDRERFFSELDI